MTNSQNTPPTANELEVSIFGPGYGESILLHVGAGNWILVDSCLDPASKQPAALKYLDTLNVKIAQAVKLVIATHWHDDHIRGLSAVFEACSSANFVLSDALNNEDFLTLASVYLQSTALQSSGLDEFGQILQLLTARSSDLNAPKWAIADRLLFSDKYTLTLEGTQVRVYALSPSDVSVLQARLSFTKLMEEQTQQRKRIVPLPPNYASVVLWVEVGNHKILLGADLENTPSPNTGWSAILCDSLITTGKAQVFKIPHHGSKNAHHQDVWCKLLLCNPYAIVSPFNRGRKTLPSPEDTQRINRLTPNAYTTSLTKQQRLKWRERIVRDYVEQVTKQVYAPSSRWGQVRLRRKIEIADTIWEVELLGDACPLNPNPSKMLSLAQS